MGQEQRNVVDFQAGIWNAVWLSGRRFFLAGDGHFGVVDLDKTPTGLSAVSCGDASAVTWLTRAMASLPTTS